MSFLKIDGRDTILYNEEYGVLLTDKKSICFTVFDVREGELVLSTAKWFNYHSERKAIEREARKYYAKRLASKKKSRGI